MFKNISFVLIVIFTAWIAGCNFIIGLNKKDLPPRDAASESDSVTENHFDTEVDMGFDMEIDMEMEEAELLHGVAHVSTLGEHTCALLDAGGVKCWGSNSDGQLGNGSITDSLTALDVAGLSSGVEAISAGGNHTCALLNTGGVECWGSNSDGQLGNGSITDSPVPVDVSGLSSGVEAISAGGNHTCTLLDTRGIKCWGRNYYGQLGNGLTEKSSIPVDVEGLSSGAEVISAGSEHTCALLETGAVQCWGWNYYGQLGDGTNRDKYLPANVIDLPSQIAEISAGGNHTCALLNSGGVKCWGSNNNGQLGNETIPDSSVPVDVAELSSGASEFSAGGSHNCALLDGGQVQCWGDNFYGQLGDGTKTDSYTPVYVVFN